MSAIQFEYPAGNIIEEITVVGHGDDGAWIFFQEALEPGHRFRVKVIGRFVQQQHVGFGQQQAAQGDAALLATRERGDIRVPGRQAKCVGRHIQFALQFPAAAGVDCILKLALFLEQRIHLLVVHRFRKLHADLVEPIQQCLAFGDTFFDVAPDILIRIQLRLLWQIADIDARLRSGFAIEVLIEASHDSQQRGLAGTVQSEHADFGAGEKTQGDVFDDKTFRRHHLGDTIHRIYVLRHAVSGRQKRRRHYQVCCANSKLR